MTRRSAADVSAAERILGLESGSEGTSEERAAAAARVYDRLADRLSPLIGAAGMRALMARSVKLTRSEFPCFDALVVVVAPEDSGAPPAQQLPGCFRELSAAEVTAAAAALFGTLLGLLTGFIGERLVSQLLQSAFPSVDQTVRKETER